MIFRDPIVIFTKWQLAALVEVVYQGDDRSNLTGLFIDFEHKRCAATDGHRLLLAGSLPVPDLHRPPSKRACFVPRDKLVEALKLARPSAGIVIEQIKQPLSFDDEVRISVVPKMLRKGEWFAPFREDPEPFMEAEDTEVVVVDKPKDPREFPPTQQVTPVLDMTRKQAIGVAGFGARYLSTVASIARSIESTIAGGATCRILMPAKSPLDPVTFYLDDLKLGAWWVYVIMPHRI